MLTRKLRLTGKVGIFVKIKRIWPEKYPRRCRGLEIFSIYQSLGYRQRAGTYNESTVMKPGVFHLKHQLKVWQKGKPRIMAACEDFGRWTAPPRSGNFSTFGWGFCQIPTQSGGGPVGSLHSLLQYDDQ